MTTILRFLVVAVGLTGFLAAQTVTKNIVYTSDATGTYKADLYKPDGNGPFPVIVYVHGGSWRSGGKGDFNRLAKDLAAKGYAGFAIDYDLKAGSWPTSLGEAEAAVRFVRGHATEYRVDPKKIVIAGTSAGGQIAALAGLETADMPVAGVVLLNSVYNMHSDAHVITRYLGGKCEAVAAKCEASSPQAHVRAGAPPFFVGHGTGDHIVPYSTAQTFIASLKADGVTVTPFVADGGPHSYWEKAKFYDDNLKAVEGFLQATVPMR